MIHAELRDRDAGCLNHALFTWWGLDLPRTMPLMEVRLEYRDTIRATAIVGNPQIATPLLGFLREVETLPDGWVGELKFLSFHENLRITCCQRRHGVIYIDVALDADREDPVWTVELRMEIEALAWPEIIRQFRDYFVVVEGEV
jgi:hypothetical protein